MSAPDTGTSAVESLRFTRSRSAHLRGGDGHIGDHVSSRIQARWWTETTAAGCVETGELEGKEICCKESRFLIGKGASVR